MYDEIEINLGNLLLSLSDAMDLASPLIASHGIRTAFIAWEVARHAELKPSDIETLFAAALLHDLGALSVEEKTQLHEQEELDTEGHCIKGASFLSRVEFLQHLAPLVRHHHDRYDARSKPEREDQQELAQIILLADTIERAVDRGVYILHQCGRLRRAMKRQAGKLIDPDVVDAFLGESTREDFWLDLESPRLYSLLLHRGPYRGKQVGISELRQISEMFRDIIDFRSRYTATHSSGVARSAMLIAEAFGMAEFEVQLMEVAGNVHDLGKLAVPNAILEKPAKLSEDEFQVMKKHTYFTYTILNTIGGLRQLPEWAAFHHERLDGDGYPFHLAGDTLDTGARILAVADVFTALAEDRPYRKGMGSDKIVDVVTQMTADNKLDAQVVRVLTDNMVSIRTEVAEWQAQMQNFYETQFVPLTSATEAGRG
jgi:putative nucleotidyltransferase with HDIG domain